MLWFIDTEGRGGERGVGEKLEGGDVEQKNKCRWSKRSGKIELVPQYVNQNKSTGDYQHIV